MFSQSCQQHWELTAHLCQGSRGSPVCERAGYVLLGVVDEMGGSLKESTN